jgi:hypothetical protein
MINDSTNNLQINLFEGPDSLINLALSKKFDEHLSLSRSGRRIWEEPEYQPIITSQSVVQLPEHLPKNRPLGFLENNVPKADRIRSILWRFWCGSSALPARRQDQSRLVKVVHNSSEISLSRMSLTRIFRFALSVERKAGSSKKVTK